MQGTTLLTYKRAGPFVLPLSWSGKEGLYNSRANANKLTLTTFREKGVFEHIVGAMTYSTGFMQQQMQMQMSNSKCR